MSKTGKTGDGGRLTKVTIDGSDTETVGSIFNLNPGASKHPGGKKQKKQLQ